MLRSLSFQLGLLQLSLECGLLLLVLSYLGFKTPDLRNNAQSDWLA